MIDEISKIKNLLETGDFEESNILIEKAIQTRSDSPDILNLKA